MTYNELSDFIKSHDEKESQSEMIKAFMMSEITSKEMDKLKDQLDAKKTAENKSSADWMRSLQYDKHGKLLKKQENLDIIATNLEKYNTARYNEFEEQVEILDEKSFTDNDANEMYRTYALEPFEFTSKDRIDITFKAYAYRRKYHPIKDKIESVKWDGKKRMETFFIDKLKVDDTPLNRMMTKLWFIAAIKRLYDPGCAFDCMIIISAVHGAGKTKLVHALGFNKYTTDIDFRLVSAKKQEQLEIMESTWIGNFDEMSNFSVAEIGEVKSFITATKDKARKAYGRYTTKTNRHCVFIGGTNENVFLKDSTSGAERRFWTMVSHNTEEEGSKMYEALTEEEILQVWAETLEIYKENPNISLYLPYELRCDLEEEQKQHKLQYHDDDLLGMFEMLHRTDWKLNELGMFENVDDFLDQALRRNYGELSNGYITKIPTSYIRAYMKSIKYSDKRTTSWIGRALEEKGWKRQTIRYGVLGPCDGYVLSDPAAWMGV